MSLRSRSVQRYYKIIINILNYTSQVDYDKISLYTTFFVDYLLPFKPCSVILIIWILTSSNLRTREKATCLGRFSNAAFNSFAAKIAAAPLYILTKGY